MKKGLQTKEEKQRQNLPYGRWIMEDGREVLFNRRYEPIRQRNMKSRADDLALPTWKHGERFEWIRQEYFFDDDTSPWRAGAGKMKRLQTIERIKDMFLFNEIIPDDLIRAIFIREDGKQITIKSKGERV